MSPSYCPLASVGDAVVQALAQDATLAALAPGGVATDVDESPTFPFVLVEVLHAGDLGGFGTKPGLGAVPDMELRLHVFQGEHGTLRNAQIVIARAVAVMADPPAVSGYGRIGIFHESTIPLADQELRGVKVFEIVASFRLLIEER
ncbi:MAG TPA: hypothetical protein VM243_11845 [Phycisphaerae bacterium]|nr:hypothetical protein [Phycisphaerae bacterium]